MSYTNDALTSASYLSLDFSNNVFAGEDYVSISYTNHTLTSASYLSLCFSNNILTSVSYTSYIAANLNAQKEAPA